jgi:general secretion pathway protein G
MRVFSQKDPVLKNEYIRIAFEKGLTLVEVILVMAIIGVLAAIAIPAYQDYQEKARVYQAITDIANISLKVGEYWQDERSYPDSLADIGLGAMLDPWGSPYRYLNLDKNGNGGARRDKNLNPLNTDYDIYSVGKNAKTKLPVTQKDSLDDVIRVFDGKFIDLAAKL